MRRTSTAGLTALGAALAGQVAWSLVLLAAAARAERPADAPPRGRLRFRVLIPAHNEEQVLPETLRSLASLDYPRELVDVVVVADHCTDATVTVARDAGVGVLERHGGEGGKAAALAWALAELTQQAPPPDAILILDADCLASPNLLAATERRLLAGQQVVQVDYTVANPEASTTVRLRWAALRLINTVRPQGRTALGLSCGLNGTGMVFAAPVLERHGWPATSLIEDREQHLLLVCEGISSCFAQEASVTSPLPTNDAAAHSQHQRWESGRWALWRAWAPRLARRALTKRDPVAAGALADLLILPQAVLITGSALVLTAGGMVGAPVPIALGAVSLAGQAGFVVGGLGVVHAPREAYMALLAAPALVVTKLRVLAEVAVGAAPRTFVRTERG